MLFTRILFAPDDGGAGGAAGGGGAGGNAGAAAAGSGAGGQTDGSTILGDGTGGAGAGVGAGAGAGGDGGQGGPVSWDAALDPSQRQLVQAKGWKSPADVVRDYGQLEGLVGRDKIALPGKDAKPEDWDKVYTALGRPESADKYEIGDFRPPEGMPWNADAQKLMLGKMHEFGLSSRQAAGLLKAYGEIQGSAWQGYLDGGAKSAERATADLRKEWGDAYDANLEIANRAVKQAFGDELADIRQVRLADGSFLLDNAAIAKAFAKLGASLSEDSDLVGQRGSGGGGAIRTPDQAKSEITRIRSEAAADPQHPYVNRKHPEYKAMQTRMNELHALAYAGSASAD